MWDLDTDKGSTDIPVKVYAITQDTKVPRPSVMSSSNFKAFSFSGAK